MTTEATDLKICVFGAGAVGGHIAGRLAKAGLAPSILERGDTLTAIRQNGLRVETAQGVIEARLDASDDPAALGVQDIVIVAVKAPALPQIAPRLTPLLKADTAVIFVMNGVPWWYFQRSGGPFDGQTLPAIDPEGAVQRFVGAERTVGAVAHTAGTVTAPGVVYAGNPRNRLILGRPDGAADARLDALARALSSASLETEVTPRIRDAVWSKLLMNLVGGSLGILTGSPMGQALAVPAVAAAAEAMTREAAAVAAAFGCDPGDFEEGLERLKGSRHKQSILQDLELGRQMEIETMLAQPLALAHMAGIDTPTLDLIVGLAIQRARAAGLYDA